MTKIVKYEVQVLRGSAWETESRHLEQSAAHTAAGRHSEASSAKKLVRVVQNTYDTETRISDTYILQARHDAGAAAQPGESLPSPSPAVSPVGRKKRDGQSINRILITLIVLAVGVFALVTGVSYLFQRGYLG